jgi:SNF2 family DNA or RNA helicase
MALPPGLEPRPYQIDGARLIASTGRALISDEPGTGKTITAILGLLMRGSTWPAVVVCPASVVDSWVDAWQTWAPHLGVVAWRGPKRGELLDTADVYVTSYDTARADMSPSVKHKRPLMALDVRSLVIDEHHMIKNHRAARTRAVRQLAKNVDTVVALSGTPITHHAADLWPTLACLEDSAWPSRERWVHRYCLTAPGDYGEEILGLNPGREAELRLCLLGQSRRVAKADVLTQLPPKVYSVRKVQLPPQHRRVYDQMEKRMIAELPDGEELSVMTVLAQMTRLAQLASAPAAVTTTVDVADDGEETEHINVKLKGPSWKVDALLEILEERPDKKTVVFAPSRQLIEIAEDAVRKAGYVTGLIVGGQNASLRTGYVNGFQDGRTQVLFATTGAGGTGLTLTAGSTVVFLQRPWSLVESLQAEDRCHRIGSEHHDSIEIIDIIASNTLDTRVRAALRAKGQQLADLVQDPRIVMELLGGSKTTTKAA